MGFFNEEFYEEIDKNYEDEEELDDEFDFDEDNKLDSSYYADNMNLNVNKSNKDKFKNIMDNASVKYDSYWDSNNLVIKFVLFVLFMIIAFGLIYYIVGWFNIMD